MKAKQKKKSKTSDLNIIMVPVEDLIPDDDNPNEMDEATFDHLIEEIREQGFDEPIHVRVHPTMEGKYQIGSGHHRTKAAAVLQLKEIPAVVKDWSDREQKVALAKRNALRGKLDKAKMVHLYKELLKGGRDAVQVQRELGFTNSKAFEKMYDAAESSLPPKQRKKLQEAKETIKSVDDLSSVLNKIFKEAGSELDEGYMVFSFGGKKHHYFQINDDTENLLQSIIAECENKGISYNEGMRQILNMGFDPAKMTKPEKSAKKENPKKSKKLTRKRRSK